MLKEVVVDVVRDLEPPGAAVNVYNKKFRVGSARRLGLVPRLGLVLV